MNDQDNDALLSRYIDGELDEAAAAEVDRRLAAEPALAARLAALRAVDADIRNAFARIDSAPVPDAVLKMLDSKPSDNVVAMPTGRPRAHRAWLPLSIAAALLVAVISFDRVGGPEDIGAAIAELNDRSVIQPEDRLYTVFESQAGGRAVAIEDQWQAQARLSFASTEGAFCRHVDVSDEQRVTQIVACRTGRGWDVEAVGTAANTPAAGDLYSPASATVTAPVEAALQRLMASSAMDEAQESRAIENGWTKTPQGSAR